MMIGMLKKDGIFTTNNEPISVLDTWSPSPSTSTSNTQQGGNNNMVVVNAALLDLSEKSNLGVGRLNNLPESECKQQKNDIFSLQNENPIDKNPNFALFCGGNVSSAYGFPLYEEFQGLDHKVEIFNNDSVSLNQVLVQNAPNSNMTHINPLFFGSSHHNMGFVNPNLSSFNTKVPILDPGNELILVKHQNSPQMVQPSTGYFQPPNSIPPNMPLLVPKQEPLRINEQQQIVYDELFKAAESIQTGNLCNAQVILARLNHFLSPNGKKPFQRSAFYIKQALEFAFNRAPPKTPSPFDCMFKMGAYKVYSEISPFTHFSNFTANQILLEALDGAQQIHIIDFDIGFGSHWSSFLQELPKNSDKNVVTCVKITAFASPSTHHSVEISLMHENFTQFANELGINFELEVINIDTFDANLNSVSSFRSSQNEAIVVNFPILSFANYLSALPSYLCFIKKLSPKILVALDCGHERIDLPFSRHVLHTLHYYEALFDSIDAANLTHEATNKIEKFIFQPRIENTVVGRFFYTHIIPPWRKLFTSAGFTPATISTFAETQAECLLKRTKVRGFHVQRRNGSLVLSWQHGELLSVSAWT